GLRPLRRGDARAPAVELLARSRRRGLARGRGRARPRRRRLRRSRIPAVTASLRGAQVGPARVWCSGTGIGNIGDHVGDDPAAVARTRARLADEAGLAPPQQWVWLRQVHGNHVVVADQPTPADTPPEADAAVTATRGLPLAIVTADCAPLVLAS